MNSESSNSRAVSKRDKKQPSWPDSWLMRVCDRVAATLLWQSCTTSKCATRIASCTVCAQHALHSKPLALTLRNNSAGVAPCLTSSIVQAAKFYFRLSLGASQTKTSARKENGHAAEKTDSGRGNLSPSKRKQAGNDDLSLESLLVWGGVPVPQVAQKSASIEPLF